MAEHLLPLGQGRESKGGSDDEDEDGRGAAVGSVARAVYEALGPDAEVDESSSKYLTTSMEAVPGIDVSGRRLRGGRNSFSRQLAGIVKAHGYESAGISGFYSNESLIDSLTMDPALYGQIDAQDAEAGFLDDCFRGTLAPLPLSGYIESE